MPSASDVARIHSAAQSDVGRTRSENQDAFGEFSTPSGERLFIVADGMGGHRGGATASRLCVETIGRAFTDGVDLGARRACAAASSSRTRASTRRRRATPSSAGMGTTAVALVLSPDGSATLGWVGDSRAYRFSDGALERLSTDHSVVGEMIRAGVLTPEEAETHPRRNELLRAIGPHDPRSSPRPDGLRHQPGDRFLLCSDGLWGPVPEAELALVLGFETPELAVKKLIAKANERGGPDNVTAQIASVAGTSWPPCCPRPAPVATPARPRSLSLPAPSGNRSRARGTDPRARAVRSRGRPGCHGDPAPQAEARVAELSSGRDTSEAERAARRTEASPGCGRKDARGRAEGGRQKAAETKAAEAKAAKAKLAEAKLAEAKLAQAKAAEAKAAADQGGRGRGRGSRCCHRGAGGREDRPAGAAQPEPVAAEAPQRAEVEHFLSSWESAIANRDFARSTRASDCRETRSSPLQLRRQAGDAGAGAARVRADCAGRARSTRANGPRAGGKRSCRRGEEALIRQTPAGLRYYGHSNDLSSQVTVTP